MTVFLVGCSSLTKSDAPAANTWWLEPLVAGAVDSGASVATDDRVSVLVDIDVIPGLDTPDILNLAPNAELSRYTGARWADDLPELLRSLVSRSLESTGHYEVVNRRNSRNLDRCQVRLQVQAFYAELSATGSTNNIRVSMIGDYVCNNSDRRVLDFDTRVPVNGDRMGSIVAAFQSGLNQAMEELITRLQHLD
jgi:ABC-type uncharacterized transport system auxiliary subunit